MTNKLPLTPASSNNVFMKLFSSVQFLILRFFARQSFYRTLIELAKQGSLTSEERGLVISKAKSLDLDYSNLTVRAKLYRTALNAAAANGNVTKDQESKLDEIQTFYAIPDAEIINEIDQVKMLRLLCEIANGNLPVINSTTVLLGKGELIHHIEEANLLEYKVIGTRYEGGSQGISVRIAKGLSYRVGNHRGRVITDKALLPVSSGEFIITNQRLIFKGDYKSLDLKLNKVMGISFADDGLIFNISNREKPYVVQFQSSCNVQLFQAVLNAVVSKLAA